MRIAITTDIHYHPPWRDRIEAFAEHLAARQPDALIIAGDIGEPLDLFHECLALFKPVAPQRAALAGNHDVWQRGAAHTSLELWEELLEEAASLHGYAWLDRTNVVFGGLGVCGTIAWYDYSGKQPGINLSDDEYERLKPMISNDGRYVNWPWTDRQMAARVGESFLERLMALQEDPAISEIIIVSHVPLFDGCQRYIGDPNREIANAYYANLSLGRRVLEAPKVRSVFSGHVHVERAVTVTRNGSTPLEVYTNPSDYGRPAALMVDTDTWAVSILRGPEPFMPNGNDDALV